MGEWQIGGRHGDSIEGEAEEGKLGSARADRGHRRCICRSARHAAQEALKERRGVAAGAPSAPLSRRRVLRRDEAR